VLSVVQAHSWTFFLSWKEDRNWKLAVEENGKPLTTTENERRAANSVEGRTGKAM